MCLQILYWCRQDVKWRHKKRSVSALEILSQASDSTQVSKTSGASTTVTYTTMEAWHEAEADEDRLLPEAIYVTTYESGIADVAATISGIIITTVHAHYPHNHHYKQQKQQYHHAKDDDIEIAKVLAMSDPYMGEPAKQTNNNNICVATGPSYRGGGQGGSTIMGLVIWHSRCFFPLQMFTFFSRTSLINSWGVCIKQSLQTEYRKDQCSCLSDSQLWVVNREEEVRPTRLHCR